MTKRIIFLCFALVSFSYGQKKELRSANKFIEKGEYASALDILDTTNDLIQASDDKTKARAMFLYGMIYTNTEDFDKAVNSFEMAKNLRDPDLLLGKCGICEYKKVCEGCRARAYFEKGNYLEEEPYCIYEPIQTQKEKEEVTT